MRFVSIVTMYLVSIGVLSVCAQNINTPENFPDPNFRAAVEEYMGVEPGGEFTAQQAAAKTGLLDCSNQQIKFLDGIEYFKGIVKLQCQENLLTSLDLSGNTEINDVNCRNNNLSTLNVTQNQNLTRLQCDYNRLESIDVSSNHKLYFLTCEKNRLTQVDISNNPELELVDFGQNNLTDIDLSNNVKLVTVSLNANPLEALDVSNNTNVEMLWCGYSNIGLLDLTKNPNLYHLSANDMMLHTLIFPTDSNISSLTVPNNLLTDVSNMLDLAKLEALDIRMNNLGKDDWEDVSALKSKLGEPQYDDSNNLTQGLRYSPQNNYDPYDFGSDNGQNINTPENFPDPNFRAAVEEYMGVEAGGEFTAQQAAAKTEELFCVNRDIESMEGIEFFVNIQALDCNSNLIQNLNVKKNTHLVHLNCWNNNLTNLDVSNNTKLKSLLCGVNPIKELDVTMLPDLEELDCSCNLTSLDVTQNPNLKLLHCRAGNQLHTLNISNNPLLKELFCDSNQLNTLDISNNKNLELVSIPENHLTSIANFLALPDLEALNVRMNRLARDDWNDVMLLRERLGEAEFRNSHTITKGFAYSPQQNYDPYDFSDQDPQPDITPTPTLPQQPFLEWEFPFEAEEEFTHIPGGFDEADAGRMALEAIPTGPASFTDGFGARLSARQGQVELLLFPELEIGNQIALIRVSVMAEAPGASVALAAVDGSLDGSMATNIPANSVIYTGGYHRMTMTYNAPGETVRPIVQLANLNAEGEVTVYFDNLEVYVIPRNVQIPSNLLYGDEEGFTPPPVITNTPTPTPTMEEPTPVIPTVQPPSKKEITIDLPNLTENAKPLEMVLIPAGEFMMGSPPDEEGRLPDETQHKVTITQPFYMGKYELTQAQWKAVMGTIASKEFGEGPNYPMYIDDWFQIQEFIEALNTLELGTFRLPTEAEWEYACRAGTTTRFYWGDGTQQADQFAWYGEPWGANFHEVGLLKPNQWGLYDMAGNTWEWCQDWYENYPNQPVIDPQGPSSGDNKVMRGSENNDLLNMMRSAARSSTSPNLQGGRGVGFRIVREMG